MTFDRVAPVPLPDRDTGAEGGAVWREGLEVDGRAASALGSTSICTSWRVGWIRSVELTAGRAGLLLAGDLQTALAQVRSETRGLSGLSLEERREDLLAFCASRSLADLRETYADTTPSSMRPPTSESAIVRRDDPSLREFGDPSPRMLA